MNKIVLFDTAIATSNLGDEIILDAVKHHLREILDSGLIMRFGTHIKNYGPFQCFRNFKIDFARTANLKFICGTNLLGCDLGGRISQFELNRWNMPLYSGSILVGVGKTSDYNNETVTSYTKKLYQKAFSHEYMHSVRDDDAVATMQALGFQAINTGCPTLWGITPERCAMIPKRKSDGVVFALSGYGDQQDISKDCVLVKTLLENYNKHWAWIQTTEDEAYIDKILCMVGNRQKIDRIYSLPKYAEVLDAGNVDYVGTRLHGGIFALQHGVRSIIIAIDRRMTGMAETNNLPILKREEIEDVKNLIYSQIETKIILKQENIDLFLSQFDELR